jgi:hypothetical protein
MLMRKIMLLILFVAVLSCTTMHKQIVVPPEVNLNHEMLQILDFTGGNDVPLDLRRGIPDEVAVQLEKLKLYQRIGRGELLESGPSLLLVGEIVQYEPQKLSGQSVINGGIVVHVQFVDKQTGFHHTELDLDCNIDKDAISREIVEFIKTNHRKI